MSITSLGKIAILSQIKINWTKRRSCILTRHTFLFTTTTLETYFPLMIYPYAHSSTIGAHQMIKLFTEWNHIIDISTAHLFLPSSRLFVFCKCHKCNPTICHISFSISLHFYLSLPLSHIPPPSLSLSLSY